MTRGRTQGYPSQQEHWLPLPPRAGWWKGLQRRRSPGMWLCGHWPL